VSSNRARATHGQSGLGDVFLGTSNAIDWTQSRTFGVRGTFAQWPRSWQFTLAKHRQLIESRHIVACGMFVRRLVPMVLEEPQELAEVVLEEP
jgi:hypothetical protein